MKPAADVFVLPGVQAVLRVAGSRSVAVARDGAVSAGSDVQALGFAVTALVEAGSPKPKRIQLRYATLTVAIERLPSSDVVAIFADSMADVPAALAALRRPHPSENDPSIVTSRASPQAQAIASEVRPIVVATKTLPSVPSVPQFKVLALGQRVTSADRPANAALEAAATVACRTLAAATMTKLTARALAVLGKRVVMNYWRVTKPDGLSGIELDDAGLRLTPGDPPAPHPEESKLLSRWTEAFVARVAVVILDFPQTASAILAESNRPTEPEASK